MNINCIFTFLSIVFLGIFWLILMWRLYIMYKKEIKVLKVSKIGFLFLLLVWTSLFIYLSLDGIDILIFRDLWDVTALHILMLVLFLLGGIFQAIMWMGVLEMGKSWRVGIDDQNPGRLITDGIFTISRNPIFFGLDGIVIVVLLLHPNIVFLIFSVGFIVGLHIQILREEKHLEKIYGESYREYKEKTSRYFYFF